MSWKRAAPLQRKTAMRRSGFSRPRDRKSPFVGLADRATAERRTTLKRRVKRATVVEGSKYLAACRGEPCYLQVPGVCRRNPDDQTVVPCHDNRQSAGKGMGFKSAHERTVPGCYWCHAWLDQGPAAREEKWRVFDRAFAQWEPERDRKMGLRKAA